MASDFDRMQERLHDWGRWGRMDCCRPDPETGSGGIYNMGKSSPGGDVWTSYKCFGCKTEKPDPGKCDSCGIPRQMIQERIEVELPPPPINVRDCEFLDVLIANKIGREHRNVIKDYYYKRQALGALRIYAAVRALLDAEYVALELGWAA